MLNPLYVEKEQIYSAGKNRNVSKNLNKVYLPDFSINQNSNQVYNLNERRIFRQGEAGPGDVGRAAVRQPEPQEAPAGGAWGENRDLGFPSGPSVAERMAGLEGADRAAESVPAAVLPAASGEGIEWAEQADRAFRRDSRRYDGGFYLY